MASGFSAGGLNPLEGAGIPGPLAPLAIESFNLNEYDLVISSSHAVAKGIITKPETLCGSFSKAPPWTAFIA